MPVDVRFTISMKRRMTKLCRLSTASVLLSVYTTLGRSGSSYSGGTDRLNLSTQACIVAEVFGRLYPEGASLQKWSFGAKAGVAQVHAANGEGNYRKVIPSIGFDVNYSWIADKNNTAYVSTGIGLTRVIYNDGIPHRYTALPTFRVVNSGYVF